VNFTKIWNVYKRPVTSITVVDIIIIISSSSSSSSSSRNPVEISMVNGGG
jgi:hypothetical protein